MGDCSRPRLLRRPTEASSVEPRGSAPFSIGHWPIHKAALSKPGVESVAVGLFWVQSRRMAKAFKFRLEPVLRFRERVEESVRTRFVEIQQIRNEKQTQLEKLQQEQADARKSMSEAKSGVLDVSRLKLMNRYLTGLMVSERQRQGELRAIDVEVEKRRIEFVEARKQVKVMDKLKDRKREEHEYEESVEQTKLFDEIAVQKVLQAKREGGRLAALAALAQIRNGEAPANGENGS